MRHPNPIPANRIKELEAYRKSKWAGEEFRRFLCVWLRVDGGLPPSEIARIIGWHPTTVRTTQQAFLREGVSALEEKRRGGRRRQLMTVEEEAAFLNAFASQAKAGSILVVAEVHAALERRVGFEIAPSTTYRMLKRHGWRKVVPRPFHPKRDPEAAEAFKKGASKKPSAKPRPKRHPGAFPSG